MLQRFTAKGFAKFMQEEKKEYINKCIIKNPKLDVSTFEIWAKDYFPNVTGLKKYGYYFYNVRTKEYFWSKTK